MITSTFLPAVLPPLPPPLELDELPDARPPTTPTTSAMSAMTATSDSENFTRLLVISLPDPLPVAGLSPGPPQIRENVYNDAATVGMRTVRVKRKRFLDFGVYTADRR